jgi:hypothetical protein
MSDPRNHSATHPPERPVPDAPPVGLDARAPAPARTTPLIADADSLQASFTPTRRLCVLCGHPLRAGQPILRVHGSTIHARCSNSQ